MVVIRTNLRKNSILLLVLAGIAVTAAPIYSVAGKSCSHNFTVTLSPTSETISRGSNFRFTIFTSGPECLAGTMVNVRASITPAATGISWGTTGYSMPLYDSPYLFGSTTLSTPAGSYTVTATVTGQQFPLVGVSESGTATLIVV